MVRHCCNRSTKVAPLHRTCQGRKAQGRRWKGESRDAVKPERPRYGESKRRRPSNSRGLGACHRSKEGFSGMTFLHLLLLPPATYTYSTILYLRRIQKASFRRWLSIGMMQIGFWSHSNDQVGPLEGMRSDIKAGGFP